MLIFKGKALSYSEGVFNHSESKFYLKQNYSSIFQIVDDLIVYI